MRVAYVAGAYRDPSIWQTTQNIAAARVVAVELWKMGFAVVCPHSNSALMDGAVRDEAFLAGSIELLRRSDLIVLMPGWKSSPGTLEESKVAEKLGMSVYHWPRDRAALRVEAQESRREKA